MALGRVTGSVVVGVGAALVEVEADVGQGLPATVIVGLPDTAVTEARDRVKAAVRNSGLQWPGQRVTVGLSPAWVPKRGPGLDLAIAVAVLAATGQLPDERARRALVVGELGLDGRVRPVRGVVAAAIEAARQGLPGIVVPVANVVEAAVVPGLDVTGVTSLAHVVAVLRGEQPGADPVPEETVTARPDPPDLLDVRGQHEARLALEVAAAGGHHVFLLGPPGVGKTMLAERLPGLLPDLDEADALEVTAVRSVAGRLGPGDGLVVRPPYEAPHHSATLAALVGGGTAGRLRPGLVSLAHRGVLLLDESPEFDRRALDALRQPLESGTVTLARADLSAVLPARFQLVLAANPCPCGAVSPRGDDCSCSPAVRRRYLARLSGPLLDRVDLRLALSRPTAADLAETGALEGSAVVAARVRDARARSASRLAGTGWRSGTEVPGPRLRRTWPPDTAASRLLDGAVAARRLTLRGADRVLRVAWTLADLAGRDRPGADEVGLAMTLRSGEQQWAA